MNDDPIVTLVICDGMGLRPELPNNAVANAPTPTFDYLLSNYPAIRLLASGTEVGIDKGEPGNSEVGHLAIGTGQITSQAVQLINTEMRSGELVNNPNLVNAIEAAKKNNSTLHLLGLISTGGIHGHRDHLLAMLDLALQHKIQRVAIHALTDGRDSPPQIALEDIKPIAEKLLKFPHGCIASVGGRYYGMDRNKRWERTDAQLWAMLGKSNSRATSFNQAINQQYAAGLSDESIVPTVITDNKNQPLAIIKPHDVIIFTNFRPDRARQLSERIIALTMPITFVTFTDYFLSKPPKAGNPETTFSAAFALPKISDTLSDVLSEHGKRQLRIAESEKYAHVTYFFDGHHETKHNKEDWEIVPSPHVDSYDKTPAMSNLAVTAAYFQAIKNIRYDFTTINYAGMDMVGHTGNYLATMEAVTAVDSELKKLVAYAEQYGQWLLITGDHGNAEQMVDPVTGVVDKEHTTNPVPFIIVHPSYKSPRTMTKLHLAELSTMGMLADIAPTILDIFALTAPDDMVGTSLLSQLDSAQETEGTI